MDLSNENLLEEGPGADFQGATLQIHQDSYLCSRSPSSLENEVSVAKLSVSPDASRLLLVEREAGKRGGSIDENGLKPGVSSGVGVVAPIISIPKRISEKFKRTRSKSDTPLQSNAICQKPILEEDEAKYFFAYRDSLVQNAIKECISGLVTPDEDGEILGSWLLTEISFWDHEKERLILLTTKVLITVKYDFIALKQLEFRKVSLDLVDTLIIGDLIYPSGSIVPSRNIRGLRAMWNNGEPLTFIKKWNPFNNDIPWTTYTSHPLLWRKDSTNSASEIYDIDDFAQNIVSAVEKAQTINIRSSHCNIEHKPIVLENYVGIGSLIHNRNSLGFFKVRGKFSF
ncbi:tumor protein p63-regulated gene 1-like protein isoform X2 [Zootermopsis nevadensis]|uniref:tumor protein p63-regulated gene 1-like protein isoform X2 n=1 Tax=Zootermopsis nevadensis TaxID=136037 RepID=UPI000B8EB55A|nr:tumor protein p63-regulated gene 1-like protein isoform X2 [Zootermopsis nevadensis]